jgi:hypothetical protein
VTVFSALCSSRLVSFFSCILRTIAGICLSVCVFHLQNGWKVSINSDSEMFHENFTAI